MNLPKQSKLIQNDIRDDDVRGNILSIVDYQINNVSLITCTAGSIRSNHYHKKDFHFMYVLEGKIDYFYKRLNDNSINYFSVLPGDNIFTPKKEIHATFFPVETKLIVSSGFPRDKETYEADTVRVNFIDQRNINKMLSKYAKI